MPLTLILLTLIGCTVFQVQTRETTGTDKPQDGIPNPASIYCEENGNILEIQTASDGSQSGVCVFQDGSTCDEWAYFRGECGRAEKQDLTTATTVKSTQKTSNDDAGKNASGRYLPPGTTEEITNLWGVIKSTDSGAQFDAYFERQDLGGVIYFGIDSLDTAVQAKIEVLRETGKIVHLYGTLFSNVPDYNGSQIMVGRNEMED